MSKLSALSASALQRQKFECNYLKYKQLKCSSSNHFTTCGAAASMPVKGEKKRYDELQMC